MGNHLLTSVSDPRRWTVVVKHACFWEPMVVQWGHILLSISFIFFHYHLMSFPANYEPVETLNCTFNHAHTKTSCIAHFCLTVKHCSGERKMDLLCLGITVYPFKKKKKECLPLPLSLLGQSAAWLSAIMCRIGDSSNLNPVKDTKGKVIPCGTCCGCGDLGRRVCVTHWLKKPATIG